MNKKIYLVRHCEAEGQPPEAALTEVGRKQANELAQFFLNKQIDQILSSPYLRAKESIEPLQKELNVELKVDNRLGERVLSNVMLSDWLEKLEKSFTDLDISYEGGESSRVAQDRGVGVIKQVMKQNVENSIIVTHGNLLALILHYFNAEFGFEQWKNLTNPDVYCLHFEKDGLSIERVWDK
jgi:2,3-bisphosphoglycerate-dependent phosphoglycerate mutase